MYRMVLTQIFRRLIIGFIAGYLLISCSTYRTLQIEVLEPAEILLDTGKTIAFMDRNIMYKSNSGLFLSDIDEFSRTDIIDLFTQGMKSVFENSERKDSIVSLLESSTTYLRDTETLEPFLPAEIRKVCNKFKLDYLVALEYHQYKTNWKLRTFSNEWLIRLYSADDLMVIDTIVYRDELKDIYLNENGLVETILSNSWNRGCAYAERIIPHWRSTERRVYHKGKALRMGYLFFCNGDKEQAKKLWEAAIRLSPKQAMKASANIAWLHEDNGDFEQAAQVLRECLQQVQQQEMDLSEVVYLREYLKIVEKRIKDSEKLDRQIGK